MGQRNTQYSQHQMHDLQSEQGLSASRNTAVPVFLYVDYPERGTSYGNQYSLQNFHAPPPNFYNPCMFPSSSNWNFPSPQYNVSSHHSSSASSMSELGRNNLSVDSTIGFGKRKDAQMPPGNQHIVNCSSTSVSLEPGMNLANSTNFEYSEYVLHPQANYVLQATHMGHSLHPSANVWMPHFTVENNIGGEPCSNWNYNNPVTFMHGRYLQSGAFELTNMGSTNATVLFNPASLPNFHPHLPLQGYGHPVQMQVPYSHPLNNVLPNVVNSSSRVLNSDSRFPHVPSNAEYIYRLRQFHHAAPDFDRGGVRIPSSEFHESNSDQHQDMRMDTDGMSYEELLALGEQIGVVKTGLTEEYIVDHLKTSMYNSQPRSRFSLEAETCIICQVEYEENEKIGTLNCSHYYHQECIKRWLLEKNLCPICKKTAFETDIKQG